MRIRTLIVDDEPLARARIRRLLHDEADVEVVGECGNGTEAVALVEQVAPDLVFLDIRMPEMDGFEVVRTLAPHRLPAIIFVTAYDHYAIRAFDVHALDYLLKPFNRERFQAALDHVRAQLKQAGAGDRAGVFAALLGDLKARRQYLEKLVVRSAGRVYFVKTEDVDWIEAAGNYIKLHVSGEAHLLRETMNSIEAKLDPSKFPRVNRSAIVNAARIKELYPLFNGDYSLILKDRTKLVLSRNYRARLFD
jgi:two-component system, LytTR family, response regulator